MAGAGGRACARQACRMRTRAAHPATAHAPPPLLPRAQGRGLWRVPCCCCCWPQERARAHPQVGAGVAPWPLHAPVRVRAHRARFRAPAGPQRRQAHLVRVLAGHGRHGSSASRGAPRRPGRSTGLKKGCHCTAMPPGRPGGQQVRAGIWCKPAKRGTPRRQPLPAIGVDTGRAAIGPGGMEDCECVLTDMFVSLPGASFPSSCASTAAPCRC